MPRHPSLTRSATDSGAVPGLKREDSQTLLSNIPLKNMASNRGTLSQYKQFSRREVDLSALSSAREAKIRKKAQVQEAIQDAISTLKKPNRGLTAKEYADTVDQRAQTARRQLNRSKCSQGSSENDPH